MNELERQLIIQAGYAPDWITEQEKAKLIKLIECTVSNVIGIIGEQHRFKTEKALIKIIKNKYNYATD